MGWIKTTTENVPEYKEILGFDESWIDPDYNPDGIRICMVVDDLAGQRYQCESAKWDDDLDCYQNAISDLPSHWCEIPKFNG